MSTYEKYTSDQLDQLLGMFVQAEQEKRQVMQTAQAELRDVLDTLDQIREEIDRRALANNCLSVGDLLEVFPESRVRYQAFKDLMAQHGLWASGSYWMWTQQRQLTFCFIRGQTEKNQAQAAAIKQLLQYVKPVPDDQDAPANVIGCRPIAIFEHTLSQYGSIDCYVRPDMTVLLRNGRWDHQELGHYDRAVEYIAKHHWYE